MAFQPVPDTVEIDVIYTLNGVGVQNSFYAELPGGYVLADLTALATAIDLQVQGTWKSQQIADALYVRTEVRGLAFENDLVVTESLSAGPGVHAGGSLPNNVTLAIKKESGLTGRSARGRTYWIGLAVNELTPVNENLLTAAYVVLIVAAVDSIRAAINGLPLWLPVLVSRFSGGLPRVAGVTFPWVSTTNVDVRVDTHRGRLPTF